MLPNFVKVSITIDDFRLRSNLNNIETLVVTKNLFLYNIWIYSTVINEINGTNLMLKSLLPDRVKVNIIFDDSRQRSNLTTNKTIGCNKIFLDTIVGFTQSRSGPLNDIEGYVQLIAG